MLRRDPFFVLLLSFFVACAEPPSPAPTIAEQAQEIEAVFETPVEYTTRHLDSAAVFAFINAHPDTKADSAAIVAFYQRRAYQYAWFVNDSLSMAARNFFDFATPSDSAVAVDSAMSDQQKLMASVFSGDSLLWTDSLRAATELELTAQFFRLADKRYSGFVQRDLRELDWYIPRRKKNVDQLLDSLVAGTMDLSPLEPLHPQYALLKEQLKQLHAWEASGDTVSIRMEVKQLRTGDSSVVIAQVRTRLFRIGDISQDNGSARFDSTMAVAVQRARTRFGLMADPVIDASLLSALNRPVADRIRQVLVNMERLRWVNADPPQDFILVNIPEYRMHVFEAGRTAWSMDVVVGATATRTVVFGGDLSMVVMAPYWNIPQSIIRGEILPAVKKNSGYLDRKRMEVVRGREVVPARSIDWSKYSTGVPFVIRQKPGAQNALGQVKFLFPNEHSIYFHDTPSKSGFVKEKRAFSHGCIRLSEPARLAEYLLRNDSTWNAAAIRKAMNGDKEITVKLSSPVPVVLGYFTAWVDEAGLLNFREDVYGHDQRLAAELFVGKEDLAAVQ